MEYTVWHDQKKELEGISRFRHEFPQRISRYWHEFPQNPPTNTELVYSAFLYILGLLRLTSNQRGQLDCCSPLNSPLCPISPSLPENMVSSKSLQIAVLWTKCFRGKRVLNMVMWTLGWFSFLLVQYLGLGQCFSAFDWTHPKSR